MFVHRRYLNATNYSPDDDRANRHRQLLIQHRTIRKRDELH